MENIMRIHPEVCEATNGCVQQQHNTGARPHTMVLRGRGSSWPAAKPARGLLLLRRRRRGGCRAGGRPGAWGCCLSSRLGCAPGPWHDDVSSSDSEFKP
eukprot:scaffold70594_cov17-Tisochrysis_lutea.AAC.2